MRKPFIILGLAALLTAAFVAPAAAARPENAGPQARPTILSTAVALNSSGPYAGQFDTLIALAGEYPGIVQALSGRQQLTLFAPTDQAFADLFALLDSAFGIQPSDLTAEQIATVLTYHVADGRWSAGRLSGQSSLTMVSDEAISISANGGVTINGSASVIAANISSSNGFIHAIDAVLVPPSILAALSQ